MSTTVTKRIWMSCLAAAGLVCLATLIINVTQAEESLRKTVPKTKAQPVTETVTAAATEAIPPQTPPGDPNERLDRIEQQIDRLTQEIEELRAIIGDTRLGSRVDDHSSDEPQQVKKEKKPVMPRTTTITDRWNSEEHRYSQGNLSGARTRSQANLRLQQDRQQLARDTAAKNDKSSGDNPPNPNQKVSPDAQRSATSRNSNTKNTTPANGKSPNATNSQKTPSDDEYKTPGELSNPADPANIPDEK